MLSVNKINSVTIESFAIRTPLGNCHAKILENALSGSLSGMQENHHYLQGRKTLVGQVSDDTKVMPADFAAFDYRANRLLMLIMDDLQTNIEQLKSRFSAHRIGIILATSTSGVDSLENALPEFDQNGKWKNTYQTHHQRMGSISEFVSTYLNISGPCMTVSTACSSGNKAFASARRWLNAGVCDAILCGGVDVLSQLTLRGFEALGALSYQQSIPFSQHRAGINIGEGTGLFILTKQEGEFSIFGCGESSDAYHISAPNPNGEGAVRAMQFALEDADLTCDDIDYINLHGTGTPHNDPMEATAIHQVFGEKAQYIACSSSKPQIGHTLGVSGVLELGLSLLSMSKNKQTQQFLPHCYDDQYDTDIPSLNLVKKENTLGTPKYILSNSFAFGGSNASIIVGKSE